MESSTKEVACSFCRRFSRLDRVFCLACRRRLSHPALALSSSDFATFADQSMLGSLKATEPLPHLIEKIVSTGGKTSEGWLSKNGMLVGFPSRLDAMVRGVGEVLGIRRLPRVYVARTAELNAFSAGTDDDPLLVICAPVFQALDYAGVEGLVAHELAHIATRHVLYHTLAESVSSGVQLAASAFAAGMMSLPIRMMLLSWYRESEASADRASLLFLGDPRKFESMMAALSGVQRVNGSTPAGDLAELMQTHPNEANRLRLAREYWSGTDCAAVRGKLIAAANSSALMAFCRRCGLVSPKTEPFCPVCGVSRA
ncbi:MAG: M48 family metalloprotease [Nitrososphaerota archaeon]|nr:M48 family metalloprotease [Nitrososphaerota archaeon]MDG7024381.1 M48 family metalloprotease [Nitrososphaerota archaeon]